jgi:predicted phosphodiesterase
MGGCLNASDHRKSRETRANVDQPAPTTRWDRLRSRLRVGRSGQPRPPLTARQRFSLDLVVGLAAALVGGWLGLMLAGASTSQVGPLTVQTAVTPALHGGTQLGLPPLGHVDLPTHSTPVRVEATVTGVDLGAATSMLTSIQDRQTQQNLTDAALSAVRRAAGRALVAALLGATALAAVLTRRWRPAVVAASTVVVVAALLGGVTKATWNANAIREPTYSGELTNAPRVIGDLTAIPDNLNQYGTELAGLVSNISTLARTLNALPEEAGATAGTVAVLHISDIHLAIQAWPIVKQVAQQYHVAFIVDTGDLADHGTSAENGALTPIADLGVPYIYVKGNHDSAITVHEVASFPNVKVLQNAKVTIDGITVAGAGDPRFTPDKLTRSDSPSGDAAVIDAAARLADFIGGTSGVQLVAFHDPHGWTRLDGYAPTLLFGHLHEQSTWRGPKGSRVFVQGSTGGAGLRALQGETPTPVTLTVLYVDPSTGKVKSFDDITLGGLGTTSAEVTRHTVNPDGTTSIDHIPGELVTASTL